MTEISWVSKVLFGLIGSKNIWRDITYIYSILDKSSRLE